MNAAMRWQNVYNASSSTSILDFFIFFLHSFEDFGQAVFGLGSSSFTGFGSSVFWSSTSFFLFGFKILIFVFAALRLRSQSYLNSLVESFCALTAQSCTISSPLAARIQVFLLQYRHHGAHQ